MIDQDPSARAGKSTHGSTGCCLRLFRARCRREEGDTARRCGPATKLLGSSSIIRTSHTAPRAAQSPPPAVCRCQTFAFVLPSLDRTSGSVHATHGASDRRLRRRGRSLPALAARAAGARSPRTVAHSTHAPRGSGGFARFAASRRPPGLPVLTCYKLLDKARFTLEDLRFTIVEGFRDTVVEI